MRSAYELIAEAMRERGVSNYRIAKTTDDDQTFIGRVLKGVVPMPDRLRLVIAELLDLDPEDLRMRLVIEREGLDVERVRAAVAEKGDKIDQPPQRKTLSRELSKQLGDLEMLVPERERERLVRYFRDARRIHAGQMPEDQAEALALIQVIGYVRSRFEKTMQGINDRVQIFDGG